MFCVWTLSWDLLIRRRTLCWPWTFISNVKHASLISEAAVKHQSYSLFSLKGERCYREFCSGSCFQMFLCLQVFMVRVFRVCVTSTAADPEPVTLPCLQSALTRDSLSFPWLSETLELFYYAESSSSAALAFPLALITLSSVFMNAELLLFVCSAIKSIILVFCLFSFILLEWLLVYLICAYLTRFHQIFLLWLLF